MNLINRKYAKIIFSIVIFSYLIYWNINKYGTFTFDSIPSAIILSSSFYLLATFFGFVLSILQNYLLATIGTLIITFLFLFKIDDILFKIPWMTQNIEALLLVLIAAFFIVKDIIFIIKSKTQ